MKAKYWMAGLLAAYTPLVLAQGVVIFGDSLSDIGQKGWEDLPAPNTHLKASYLKADGTPNSLYGEHLARALGGTLTASSKGGSDYAHSGGVVVAEHSPKNMAIQPRVSMDKQIDQYLAKGANRNDLHILWGGGNDMAAILKQAMGNQDSAASIVNARTQLTADTSGRQWARLKQAGVDLVVAPDVPNVLYTPEILDQFAGAVAENVKTQIEEKGGEVAVFAGTGTAARDEINAIYKRLLPQASAGNQKSVADFTRGRAQLLDTMVDELWNAKTSGITAWRYATYGELFSGNGISKEDIKKQVGDNYTAFAGAATQATDLLNGRTTQALNAQGGNIVRLAANQMFADMLSDPAKYGFDNTLGRACNDSSASVLCGVDLKDAGKQAANANADKMLFADSFHPGPKAHKIMADYLLSTLQAPGDMAGLRTVGLQNGEAAWNFVRQDSNHGRSQRQPAHTVDAVASYQHNAGGEGGYVLHAGAKAQLSDAWQLGVVFSRQDQDSRFGNTRVNAKTNSITSTLRYDAPQWWLGGMVQLNDADYQTNRHIRLGEVRLTQHGETSGMGVGVGMFGGYEWQFGQTRVAALGDLTAVSGKVHGFSERSGGATQMQFGEQKYTTLHSGLGAEVGHVIGSWQPYANLRWVKDWRKNNDPVEAGMNGSRFQMTAPATSDTSWLNAQLGVQWQPQGSRWRAFASAGRDLGRSSHSQTALQVGVGARF